jgi:hypothetical protein
MSYTKIYMIYRIFKIDLLDFQGFNPLNFRKSILFEYNYKMCQCADLIY